MIASECFDSADKRMLASLAREFVGYRIQIVANLRSFPSLFLSSYEQVVIDTLNKRWCRAVLDYFPASEYLMLVWRPWHLRRSRLLLTTRRRDVTSRSPMCYEDGDKEGLCPAGVRRFQAQAK